MNAPLNLVGRVFGRLTVVRRDASNRHGQASWECRCSCGRISHVVSAKLVNGNTWSCGCARVERILRCVANKRPAPRGPCEAPGCKRLARDLNGKYGQYCGKHIARIQRAGRIHLIRRENGTGWMAKKYVQVSIHSRRTYEHIVVAERAFGGPLPKGAVVHHVNLDTHDNRPCNLVICPNEAYHRLLHKRMRERGWYDELRPEFRHVA